MQFHPLRRLASPCRHSPLSVRLLRRSVAVGRCCSPSKAACAALTPYPLGSGNGSATFASTWSFGSKNQFGPHGLVRGGAPVASWMTCRISAVRFHGLPSTVHVIGCLASSRQRTDRRESS